MTVSTLPRGKCAWRKLRVKALLFVWEHSSTYIHILCTVTCKSNPCLSKAAYIVDIICPQNKYSLHFTTSPNLYDFLLWNNKLARILVLLLFFTQWKWMVTTSFEAFKIFDSNFSLITTQSHKMASEDLKYCAWVIWTTFMMLLLCFFVHFRTWMI